MARAFYEVWDDGTANRVGGSFDTEEEARALLADVLAANGPDVVSDLAILAFRPNADGRYDPETVLEGSDFIADAGQAETAIRRAV